MTEALHTAEGREYSRRAAFAIGSAAVAGLALSSRAMAQSNTITDQDILNFALNLEYLEAEFYTLATTGKTIDQVGVGITGGVYGAPVGTVTVKPDPMVPFTSSLLKQFAMELATDEQNHVKFLRNTLGSNVVAQPNIDLENSFNVLAKAAGLGDSFDPFASDANFLLGAFIFEDVGVTAYLGAAGKLSNKTYLDAAAGIMAVEGYHAASIRERIFAAGAAAQQASIAIAKTRATLDGSGNDDVGVSVQNGAATIVDDDPSTGMAYSRTAAQVLKIVYGGGTSGGAFFPKRRERTHRVGQVFAECRARAFALARRPTFWFSYCLGSPGLVRRGGRDLGSQFCNRLENRVPRRLLVCLAAHPIPMCL